MSDYIFLETDKQYITNHYTTKEPAKALAELIWNSLDAGANKISVEFDVQGTSIESITVTDNGKGINHENIETEFGRLGFSNKKNMTQNEVGRFLHGKKGEGRLYSLAIGNSVTRESKYHNKEEGAYKSFSVSLNGLDKKVGFLKTDPVVERNTETGVVVTIKQITENFVTNVGDLDNELFEKLQLEFAHYLLTYGKDNITILLNGKKLDPAKCIIGKKSTSFKNYDEDSKKEYLTNMQIYHREKKSIHSRYICTVSGSILFEDGETGLQHKEFGHSIHLSGDYFQELDANNQLLASVNSKFFKEISVSAKKALSEYYFERKKELASTAILKLKEEGVYPYKEEPKNKVEKLERDIFDITAHTILSQPNEYITGSKESKSLTLELIKETIHTRSDSLVPIMKNIVKLSDEELKAFSELITEVGLKNIITIAGLIRDKIFFLKDLDILIYDPDLKKKVLERQHLHKVLEKELWIFGEQYALGTSDQKLEDVLKAHLNILGRKDFIGSTKSDKIRPDLFLSKQIAGNQKGVFHHLVIEIKRPSLILGFKETTQIMSYAQKVANDSRFDKENTQRDFVLIGNDFKDEILGQVSQKGKEKGVISEPTDGSYTVRVLKWSELIQDLEWKYGHIEKELSQDDITIQKLDYIKKHYSDIINIL